MNATLFPIERESTVFRNLMLTDLISGESIEIIAPSRFVLETVMIDSAYYWVEGKQYRFRLPDARCAGLKIQK